MTKLGTRLVLVAGLGAVLALPVTARQQTDAELTLRQAIEAETVTGDLRGAIEQYKKVADGSDRALAATALLRMAGAYEKLGEAQARDTYQRIVNEFADQRTQVLEAQTRLNALAPPLANQVTQVADGRVVLPSPNGTRWLGGGIDYGISPDGRYGLVTSYVDPDGQIAQQNVGLFEYETRKFTWITDYPDVYKAQADGLVMSPDGSRVAYSVNLHEAPKESQVHVVTLGDAGKVVDRKVVARASRAPRGSGFGFGFWLFGWTPNDELIVNVAREDRWWQVSRLDISNGQLTQIASFPPETVAGDPRLSPDGRFLTLMRRHGEDTEIVTLAVDGSKMSRIGAIQPPTFRGGVVGWARDGSHLLFVSEQLGQRDLWAVPVAAGERAGAPFVVQRDYSPERAPVWVGDRTVDPVEDRQTSTVVAMDLDEDGAVRRLTSAPDTQESNARWSSRGDLAYLVSGNRRLVIQRPDGSTRERLLPEEGMLFSGFNVEGTAVVAVAFPPGGGSYPSDQPRYLNLYDLETDAWSPIEIPGARPGWRVQPGFTAVQGGADDFVIYYPVARRDDVGRRNLGPFEIHRQDAEGHVTTVYASDQPLDLGPRPFWLSADGSALRFVEGRSYRELDLGTGTVRDLTSVLDDDEEYLPGPVRAANPVSSADGRTVVVRVRSRFDLDTFRIVDVAAGASRELTVQKAAIVRQQIGLTPEEKLAEVRVTTNLSDFQVSPAGDRLTFSIRARVPPHFVLVDDPLAKYLAARGAE